MSFFNRIKKNIQRKTISKRLEQETREKNAMSFQRAKKVGLIFDATELDRREVALKYVESLRDQKKLVWKLGFFQNQQDKEDFSFKYFTQKDINWKGTPQKEDINQFLDHQFDLFINLSPVTNLYTEVIAALSKAHLKLGPVCDNHNCYDLMIDSKDTMEDFITQMELLLQKTNNSHEPTQV